MTPLRILFAIHGAADPHTAVYANIWHRADSLRAAGHTVDIVTPDDMGVRWLSRFDPLVLPLAVLRRRLGDYDVVLFHSYLGWGYHALRRLVDPAARVATVTMFHGLEPLYHRATVEEARRAGMRLSTRFRLLHHVILPPLLKFTCRASDRVLCLNEAERRFLVDEGWADESRIAIVANGIEPGLFVQRTHRERATALLFLAQWLPQKGTRYLVQMFSELARRRPDVRLACVGVKVPSERVLSAFPEAVRPLVTVQPDVDRQELARVLHSADVFVFPSVYEGFGNVAIEAMAAGLPIVSTRVGAAADLLEHGKSALFVDVGDGPALLHEIERLIDDRPLRQRLGEAAQRRALGCLWDRVNEDYSREVLCAVAARRAARSGAPTVNTHDVA